MSDLHTEIAIVGAGPAGLAAALAVCEHGRAACLIDDNPKPGGQIWRAGLTAGSRSATNREAWLTNPAIPAELTARLARVEGLRVLPAARVVATQNAGSLLLEDASQARYLHYQKLIVASGARELLLPFPGWTLPGVTGAGGLQALVKQGLDVSGKRIVLAGSGPLLLASAATLRAAGAQVLLIAEQAASRQLAGFVWSLRHWPAKLAQAARLRWALRGVPYRAGSHVLAALGKERLQSVRLQQGQHVRELACDWLGVGFGLVPNTELLQALGCALQDGSAKVDALLQCSQPNVFAVGEACGIGGVDKALLEGRMAGLAAAGQVEAAQALIPARAHQLRFAAQLAHHFSLDPAIRQLADAQTLVCRCEDVRHGDLLAYNNWREAKLQTRCGMGACQGRICGAACATLYGWPVTGSRPPIQPTRLGSLLQLETTEAPSS
ncbi:NAD(P)/FAD-dependent oxidoreductase [Chitinimonas sp. BJB300]|uniref:NAD(P)/FAD-dependent oxidoreductase n=1 Tax=Chitinimonas sp. BJB300 TaxID=1559339 RepID=UPI000C0E7AA3|nr:FAD/NAD(P)-binding oxidoreductase [Chitinimonas sp. BJB300]PHV12597.1 FAD/NAD(P)-binding oxidoreductase [Chitinimonas sp. BJB300]TSJ90190.1 NAD(P)/FAD-dependent oxidoreductase [Chitinimonas sp. BJB300]